MRALSLWQPWATAIALGSKTIETRHWPTAYRGPLAIHAAKRRVLSELRDFMADPHWIGALSGAGWTAERAIVDDEAALPFGAIVAVCDLVDVRRSETFTLAELHTPRHAPGEAHGGLFWTEDMMGNFGPERFGWVLDDIRPLPTPVPYRGAQGLFEIPDEIMRAALASEDL